VLIKKYNGITKEELEMPQGNLEDNMDTALPF